VGVGSNRARFSRKVRRSGFDGKCRASKKLIRLSAWLIVGSAVDSFMVVVLKWLPLKWWMFNSFSAGLDRVPRPSSL